MFPSRRVVIGGLALVQLAGFPALGAEPPHVLWRDARKLSPLFLDKAAIETLGNSAVQDSGVREETSSIPRNFIVSINEEIARVTASSRARLEDLIADRCPYHSAHVPLGDSPDGSSFARPLARWLLMGGTVAYVGRVRASVPGYIVPQSEPGTLYQLDLVERLNSAADSQLSSFLLLDASGWLTLGDKILCSNSGNFQAAKSGETLLVWGRIDPANEQRVMAQLVLRVRDGVVDVSNCKYCNQTPALSLSDLRSAMHRREN